MYLVELTKTVFPNSFTTCELDEPAEIRKDNLRRNRLKVWGSDYSWLSTLWLKLFFIRNSLHCRSASVQKRLLNHLFSPRKPWKGGVTYKCWSRCSQNRSVQNGTTLSRTLKIWSHSPQQRWSVIGSSCCLLQGLAISPCVQIRMHLSRPTT
jgi:hypothetical protein